MYRYLCILFCVIPSAASAQTHFNYPAPTEVAAVANARGAYRITLDTAGSPVLFCWKDDGMFQKACSKIEVGDTAGFSGFQPSASSDFYDVRTIQITYVNASWEAEPEWSVPWGCVDSVLVVNDDVRKIHIDASSPIEAVCDASLGGVLGAVCDDIAVNDCGTFEGHITGTQIFLDQALAHKGFLSN